ncbi:MAG: undecaprenyl-diphosphate phosphatase [Butyricicoccus sp.]
MIELLKAFLFGIVEGITEWLPISSTGHMILLNEFVKLDVSEAFYSMFEVVIQLGAILAVVVLFWGQIFLFERRKGRHGGASIVLNMDTVKLWIKILVACVPAAIVGLKWNDLFEELFYNYQTVSIALIVFGAAFILVENAHKGKPARINALTELTYPTVFMIGMFQLIAAVFPGTSRSGATIVGALLLGVSRTVAAEFTFFLAFRSFRRKPAQDSPFGFAFTSTELMIPASVQSPRSCPLSSSVSDELCQEHDFKVFGWYRIISVSPCWRTLCWRSE